ncbi:fimbria/pilus periplasmic chaperone, partial [Salmonella enterica subsp. enterica serovar Anatum]|nr:fimbria/pilus periplasmic chaperone [Salmonella enterica subsp. enterica serovar Anatum]
ILSAHRPQTIFPNTVPNAAAVIKLETTPVSKPSPAKYVGSRPIRVEAGQQQQLRFIMESTEPLTVEHYKRVTFEGIPPKSTDKG